MTLYAYWIKRLVEYVKYVAVNFSISSHFNTIPTTLDFGLFVHLVQINGMK